MRKTLLLLILISSFVVSPAKAQYVTISDSNFRDKLIQMYPSCFNIMGQMDTTCNEIVNAESLNLSPAIYITSLNGLQYFKQLKHFICWNGFLITDIPQLPPTLLSIELVALHALQNLPALPPNLTNFNCTNTSVVTFPSLPLTLDTFICDYNAHLSSLPALPVSLKYLQCREDSLTRLPALPSTLEYLDCFRNPIDTLPEFPDNVSYINCSETGYPYTGFDSLILPALPARLKRLECFRSNIRSLPSLPDSLEYLDCSMNSIAFFPQLPLSLTLFRCRENNLLTSLSSLPNSLKTLDCNFCYALSNIVAFPDSLQIFFGSDCNFSSLPPLPSKLNTLICDNNSLAAIPMLPSNLDELDCSFNQIISLGNLPGSLTRLNCSGNQLTSLPVLPLRLKRLYCEDNNITSLPVLPDSLGFLLCSKNQLTSLPELPEFVTYLSCAYNEIYCLPKLPTQYYFNLTIDSKIKCLPNENAVDLALFILDSTGGVHQRPPLCNPTNNEYQCQAFPVMQGSVFYDNNSNGIKDPGEPVKKEAQVMLSDGKFTFTNNSGDYEIGANDTGSYHINITAPQYFNVVPSVINYNFTSYDTLVVRNFALQPTTTIDEIRIRTFPVNWAARPGFSFPYLVRYENTGTTTLNPTIAFTYDNTRLDYDSSSDVRVNQTGNNLTLNTTNLVTGDGGSFVLYFRLKTTVPIGDTVKAIAMVTANSFSDHDSVTTRVGGSFDPNDKHATPQLSPSQVANGDYIDYTIRFQNTGTDTAFNIVITDTLNEDLQANTLQMQASSHSCKATVKGNIVFFEFLNILLPDSNINEPKSHGFVSFRIKPQATVQPNTTIPNKAAIYFDYNAPVITNIAGTLIKDFIVVPLKLISFSAVSQTDNTTILYWNTANEINTKHFVVEKSNDGLRFNSVKNVVAKGKANNNYSTTVADANTGVIFYRLKIVDADGSFTYSPIIKIDRRKNAGGISVLSNPVKDVLILSTADVTLNNTQASIINMQGAVMKIFIIKVGSQAIDIKDLPTGIYYIKTITGSSKILIR